MSPTLLGGSAPTTGTSSTAGGGSTSAGSNASTGGSRQDFDAMLKGSNERPHPSEASAKQKPKNTDSSQSKDDNTAAKDPSGKCSTGKPGHADETSSDATLPATASAEASSPAEPATRDEAEAAPWPPLGLAGLALTGLVPAAADAQAAPAASTPVVADPLLAGKADNLLTANPAAPGGPTAAAPAVTAAATSTDAGPIALPLDAAANDDIALPKALADALSTGATDADAPATPFLHALQTAAELKTGAASAPFAGSPTATPHVGGESFDEDISARIGWLADQKIGHATIKVTPHDLGLIEVRLQMDGDKVHASFSSAHADVRHALESTLPRLREMLNDQGFQLGNADVGHQHTAQDGKSGGGSSDRGGIGGDGEPGMIETTVSPSQLMRQRGLLDAYA